jgi:hypothetical protein
VNRLDTRATGGREQRFLVQVALGRGAGPNAVGLVGRTDVQRVTVGIRVDRDGADPELPQRAEEANRNLAAVGYENLRKERQGLFLLKAS